MSGPAKIQSSTKEEDSNGVEEVISAPTSGLVQPAPCGGATFSLSPIPATNPFADFPFASPEDTFVHNVPSPFGFGGTTFGHREDTPFRRNVPIQEEVETAGVPSRSESSSTASTLNENVTFDLGNPSKGGVSPVEHSLPSMPPPDYSSATGNPVSPAAYRGTIRELDLEEVAIDPADQTEPRRRRFSLLRGRRMPPLLRTILIVLGLLVGAGLIILVLAFFAGAFNRYYYNDD